jgi:hypothetical protein
MIDIRDKKQVLAALRQAKRSFEKGAPVPYEARELLDELAEALAGTGPFELGVSSCRWLERIDWAKRGLAAANDHSSAKAVRRTRAAIHELTRSFGGMDWTWIERLMMPFVIVATLYTVICMLVFVPLIVLVILFRKRYLPDVRKVVTTLELPDRVLFAQPVRATRVPACSPRRARFGAYVHPVLVATDRRVVLAEPTSDLPARRDRQRFSITWEASYSRIRAIGTRVRCDSQIVAIDTDEYKMPRDEARALVAIITRHAPECQLSGPEIVPEYATGDVTSSASDTLGPRAASSAATASGEKV